MSAGPERRADPGCGAASPGAHALRALQRELQRHLLHGDPNITAAIVEAPPLSAAERLGIYHNAYRVRLVEALDDTYPKLHLVLGDELFAALGESFVAANPSVYRSIRWYGRELADTLIDAAPFAEQPILAELARLEWTLAEVFDSGDAEPVTRAALSAIEPSAWGEIRLELHPSLRRLDLEWNSVAVWQALSREESPPEPEQSERPVAWLLWRQNLGNYFRSLTADEAAALEAARRGATFGEICGALGPHLAEDEIPLRAAGLLGAWADAGLIAAVKSDC
ncbi:MAG TPA: DNA-binding domain-containing protein [Steroidobacteraceae bacterium]|jgi:hypothetical protein|nr:DNA-binding domain-containing protein [Steroidobacteraceae bacterium]